MKTLLTLILMLVSFNLFGQGQPFKSTQNDTVYAIIYVDTTCCVEFMPRDEIIRNLIYENYSLKSLWDYYKEDCYNDSTLDVFYDYYGNPVINKIEFFILDTVTLQRKLIKEEDIYIHTKPTFEGFITWMNNKLNIH